jgi:hypothetical protein
MNVKTSRHQPEADQPRNLLGAGVLCLGLDHKNTRCSRHMTSFAIRRASFQLQDSISPHSPPRRTIPALGSRPLLYGEAENSSVTA